MTDEGKPEWTVAGLRALADELAAQAKHLGIRSAVVLLSTEFVDGQGLRHSRYGASFFGSCLEIDGLARRATVCADENWKRGSEVVASVEETP